VRNRDVNRDHPRALRPFHHRPSRNVSGTAREKSRRAIGDFFPKTKNDFAALERRRAFDRTMQRVSFE
jgi:hypothetical protein